MKMFRKTKLLLKMSIKPVPPNQSHQCQVLAIARHMLGAISACLALVLAREFTHPIRHMVATALLGMAIVAFLGCLASFTEFASAVGDCSPLRGDKEQLDLTRDIYAGVSRTSCPAVNILASGRITRTINTRLGDLCPDIVLGSGAVFYLTYLGIDTIARTIIQFAFILLGFAFLSKTTERYAAEAEAEFSRVGAFVKSEAKKVDSALARAAGELTGDVRNVGRAAAADIAALRADAESVENAAVADFAALRAGSSMLMRRPNITANRGQKQPNDSSSKAT